MSATLEWNGAKFLKALQDEARKALDRSAGILQGEVKQNLARKASNATFPSPSTPGSPPAWDSGSLAQSIQIDRSGMSQENPRVRVGTDLVYAAIQEFGGVVRAKKTKYLPVPLSLTAKRLQRRAGGSVKKIPGLYLVVRKGVKFLCRDKKSASGRK